MSQWRSSWRGFAREPGRTSASLLLSLLLTTCLGMACGEDPEAALLGRWRELGWRYEKTDGRHVDGDLMDDIQYPDYPDRRIVRHEAEHWEFQPQGRLVIRKRSGEEVTANWRLKGRGHVLVIRYDDTGALEVYDVKDLTRDTLIIHYDIGMEVRGIAKLTFGRMATGSATP